MFWRFSAYILIVFSFVVLTSSQAFAFIENVAISHVKTGQSGALTNEFVAVYNNSETPVNVSGWCLYYSPSSNSSNNKLACIESSNITYDLYLGPFSHARFATIEFKSALTGFEPDFVFPSAMSASGGHLKFFNSDNQEVDKIGWGSAISPETLAIPAHQSGLVFLRKSIENTSSLIDTNNNSSDFMETILTSIPISGLYEELKPVDVCTDIEGLQTTVPDDYFVEGGSCHQDQCDNIDALQISVPEGYVSLDGENCEKLALFLETSVLSITELLPNSASTDTGNEFIEVYNPNTKAVNLKGYKLELGPAYTKSFTFADEVIAPFAYKTFSDTYTGLVLPNSNASLRFLNPVGEVVSQTEEYFSPKDNMSWAQINGEWQYTDVVTPGATNLPSKLVVVSTGGDEELEPCGEGKYRNPETNRCRNIEIENDLVACKLGQERNPDTNRCRSSANALDSLVPCKEGQERNPETNRCKSVITTASALVPCKAGEERNSETNRCRKISNVGEVAGASVTDIPASQKSSNGLLIGGAILLAVAGYATYEWRSEIGKFYNRLLAKFKPGS